MNSSSFHKEKDEDVGMEMVGEHIFYDNETHTEASNMDHKSGFFDQITHFISIYGLTPLCVVGIIFNFASMSALYNNKLRLRKSLIQLFIFLNISDV